VDVNWEVGLGLLVTKKYSALRQFFIEKEAESTGGAAKADEVIPKCKGKKTDGPPRVCVCVTALGGKCAFPAKSGHVPPGAVGAYKTFIEGLFAGSGESYRWRPADLVSREQRKRNNRAPEPHRADPAIVAATMRLPAVWDQWFRLACELNEDDRFSHMPACVAGIRRLYRVFFGRPRVPVAEIVGEPWRVVWNHWVRMCRVVAPVRGQYFDHVPLAIGPVAHHWLCHGGRNARTQAAWIDGASEVVGENSLRHLAMRWNAARIGFTNYMSRPEKLMRVLVLAQVANIRQSADVEEETRRFGYRAPVAPIMQDCRP
jgi:hypothetical protein